MANENFEVDTHQQESVHRCNDCGTAWFLSGKITDPAGGYLCGSCASKRVESGKNGKTVN